jgi:peptidoglycan/xylan/chitin deacetylase (PgdA/CDA1 family)
MSTWPDGYQSAAVITVNFDGESFEQPLLPNEPLWGRYSFGRYGAQLGVHRILEVLERYAVRATYFIPGWDVERYPDAMEAIASAGHELAGRGYANEDFSTLAADDQRGVLERSEAVFTRVFGQAPAGWRAPGGAPAAGGRAALAPVGSLMSAETRAILAERGYRYDSSYCDDDVPYVVANARGERLVELPQFTTATDAFYYQAHRSPFVVSAAWREDLSAVHEAGGLFNLALSPRGDWGSGRGVRIRAVADILQALHETPGVWLTTCAEVASWALENASEDPRPA